MDAINSGPRVPAHTLLRPLQPGLLHSSPSMTATQPSPIVALPQVPSLDTAAAVVKMEDRKRSFANDAADDSFAPSRKRVVKDENGQQMRMDAEKERDVEVSSLHPFNTCPPRPSSNESRDQRIIKKMPSSAR